MPDAPDPNPLPPRGSSESPRLLIAGAVVDPDGVTHRPGGVLVRDGRAVRWGPASDLEREHGPDAQVTRRPDRLLMPGLINAHAHLELTHIGPRPYAGDFIGWVVMLREHWPGGGEPMAKLPDVAWFADAARHGAQRSRAAGVEIVGDISRCAEVTAAQRDEQLQGVGYRELFGLGPPWHDETLQQIEADTDAQAAGKATPTNAEGWQPHAPYSAGPAVYAAAARSGLPVSTHLAETPDELRFIAQGDGPFRDFLQRIGKWHGSFGANYGRGLTPVQWMEPHLRRVPWLLAHCNYVTDADLVLLAETDASVAYCPIASDYFGHPQHGREPHRYREMLDAGVNVCLGTDSAVCQPAGQAQPLGVLPQMRYLHRRDGTDPAVLFRMATGHGRRALHMDNAVTLLCSVGFDAAAPTDPLTQALRHDGPSEGLPL